MIAREPAKGMAPAGSDWRDVPKACSRIAPETGGPPQMERRVAASVQPSG